jgi:DNA-directed RNA polymerase subunit N (RpoN/RPB10)
MALRPVTCLSCGKGMTQAYATYRMLRDEDGYSESDSLSELGLSRLCCLRTVQSAAEIQHFKGERLNYDLDVKFPQGARRAAPQQQVTAAPPAKPKPAASIPHLHSYVPGSVKPFGVSTMFISEQSLSRGSDVTDTLPDPVEWTARSRILTLIWFLTRSLKTDETKVLWLGCSGITGEAMKVVLDLFRGFTFILSDWRPMEPSLSTLARHPDYRRRLTVETSTRNGFTDADASALRGDVNLFFCEYFRADSTRGQLEVQVGLDMRNQLNWCRLMEPEGSLLRFLLPRTRTPFEYPQGELLVPPWASPHNLVAYLSVRAISSLENTSYDSTTQIQRMNYHNRVVRLSGWLHSTASASYGLDTCWDCACECAILTAYSRTVDSDATGPVIVDRVRKLTSTLSVGLDPTETLTLLTPPRPPVEDEEPSEAAKKALP